MDALSTREEARLHREAYSAAVRAALEGWERKGVFAARIGRSRQYLYDLLHPDDPRTPSRETAERMANALPVSPEQRNDVLGHMLLAAEHRLRAWRSARQAVAEMMPAETLDAMRAAHWDATYARDPTQARPHFHRLRDLASGFLLQGGLQRQPLVLVEACLLLHDAQSVLDRPADALFSARLARTVMEDRDRDDYRQWRDRFDHLHVNTAYAEAVTLTTFGLAREAEEALHAAAATAAGKSTAVFWTPHIYRHRLAALSEKPRFSLSTARELADLAQSACEQRNDPLDPQVSLLIDASLARAYLRYGSDISRYGSDPSARKAIALLRPSVESIDRVPYLGPVHRVTVLRTFALACRAGNRLDEWQHYIQLALQTASAAGLAHQMREIRQENGRTRAADA